MYYIQDRKGNAHPVKSKKDYIAWWKNRPVTMRTACGVYIAFDIVNDIIVSTVFLGKSAEETGEPVLWETAIIENGEVEFWRYASIEDARSGHKYICEGLKNGTKSVLHT